MKMKWRNILTGEEVVLDVTGQLIVEPDEGVGYPENYIEITCKRDWIELRTGWSMAVIPMSGNMARIENVPTGTKKRMPGRKRRDNSG